MGQSVLQLRIDRSFVEIYRTPNSSRRSRLRDGLHSFPKPRDVEADFKYPAKTFMTDHKEIITGRGLPILRRVDLFIRTIESDPSHLH